MIEGNVSDGANTQPPEAPLSTPEPDYRARAVAVLEGKDPNQVAPPAERPAGAPPNLLGKGEPETPQDGPEAPDEAPEAREAPPVDETGEEGAEAAEEERPPPDSDAWAAILEAERKATVERQKIKQERQAFEEERAQWQKENQALLDAVRRIKEGDPEALEALGTSYNDFIVGALNRGENASLEPMKKEFSSKIEQLEAELQKEREERTRVENETRIKQAYDHIRNTLVDEKAPDRWSLLKRQPNWEAEVREVVRLDWERSGRPDDYRYNLTDVADRIETFLAKQAEERFGINPKAAQTPRTATDTPSLDNDAQRTRANGRARRVQSPTSADAGQVGRFSRNDMSDEARKHRAAELLKRLAAERDK